MIKGLLIFIGAIIFLLAFLGCVTDEADDTCDPAP